MLSMSETGGSGVSPELFKIWINKKIMLNDMGNEQGVCNSRIIYKTDD